MTTDVIDHLAEIPPGSALDAARHQRPEARKHAQAGYDALFTPIAAGTFSVRERRAVAAFIALLHNQPQAAEFYAAALQADDAALARAIRFEAARAAATGPFGAYPPGPLTAENRPGKTHHANPAWWATNSPPR